MTQVGHTLCGAAIGAACRPDGIPVKWTVVHCLAFMFLANVPDLPLRNWGHDRYEVSHYAPLLLLALVVRRGRAVRENLT